MPVDLVVNLPLVRQFTGTAVILQTSIKLTWFSVVYELNKIVDIPWFHVELIYIFANEESCTFFCNQITLGGENIEVCFL